MVEYSRGSLKVKFIEVGNNLGLGCEGKRGIEDVCKDCDLNKQKPRIATN